MGSIAGGETVVIVTDNFRGDFKKDTPVVLFGGDPALNVTPLSADIVSAVTPPHPTPESVDVQVESADGSRIAPLAGGFSYGHTVELFGKTVTIPSARVVYVIKRAGSMGWGYGCPWDCPPINRWQIAVDATIDSIRRLPDQVRFNVVTYACDRDAWSSRSRYATSADKAEAEAWLQSHFPWGGSGTGPGVSLALQEKENLTLLFTTEGHPNCGATGTSGHLSMILSENTQGAAIHTFGIRTSGIFRAFLQDMAAQTGGTYTAIVQ